MTAEMTCFELALFRHNNGAISTSRASGPVGSPSIGFRAPGSVGAFDLGPGLGGGWSEGAGGGMRVGMPWGGSSELHSGQASSWPGGGFAGQWGEAGARGSGNGDADSRMMELTLVRLFPCADSSVLPCFSLLSHHLESCFADVCCLML